MRDDGANVAQAICDGTARAVSDGSYLISTGNGSAGYVLLVSSRHLRIEGSLLVVPGCSLTMNSHVTIGCDGQDALWQALGSSSPISPSASDFDLVAAIRRKIQAVHIRTSMKWIKGHQDSLPGESLNLWARLNISMDLLAKQCRALHDRRADPDDLQHNIEGEPWQLIRDGKKLHLDHGWNSLPAPDLAFYPPNLHLAILVQSKIGWQNFLDAFVAHQWDVVQSEYYEQTHSRRSPNLWLAGLIRQMWNLSHAMWTHHNAAQHAAEPEVALTLEASIDQSIQDHFIHGFAYLDRRCSYPLYRGGVRCILSKPLPAKVQWLQNLVTAREHQWRLQGRTGPNALMHPERSLARKWLSLGNQRSARNPAKR
eukprot:scaffold14292_cov60-Attheya_sp.AAC.3